MINYNSTTQIEDYIEPNCCELCYLKFEDCNCDEFLSDFWCFDCERELDNCICDDIDNYINSTCELQDKLRLIELKQQRMRELDR